MAASGDIGRKMPTRSPARIPSAFSALASRLTSAVSSAYQVRCGSCQSSPSQMMAGYAARRPSECDQAVVGEVQPAVGNQRGHAGPRVASSTRLNGRVNRMPRSSTTPRQYHSGSSTERRCSSSSVPTPSRRMSRVIFARSMYSAVAAQRSDPHGESYDIPSRMSDNVRLDRDGPIATVTLKRPRAPQLAERPMLTDLGRAFAELRDDAARAPGDRTGAPPSSPPRRRGSRAACRPRSGARRWRRASRNSGGSSSASTPRSRLEQITIAAVNATPVGAAGAHTGLRFQLAAAEAQSDPEVDLGVPLGVVDHAIRSPCRPRARQGDILECRATAPRRRARWDSFTASCPGTTS